MKTDNQFDVIVLGGGAAGLLCALTAGQRGKRVLVLEVSNKIGKKILMSGGGRCNFTNLDVTADNFICANPHFVKSALSQYTQWDFISMVVKHEIAYHEKTLGQLFCDDSAKQIVAMLLSECEATGVEIKLKCETQSVQHGADYHLTTNQGVFSAESLVVATGGLSIPTLGGATGLGYQLAEQFGLSLAKREASLVPFTLSGKWHDLSKQLSGVAIPVSVSVPAKEFSEAMLFTHRGLSGPAILQLSNYWSLGEKIEVDLCPTADLASELLLAKQHSPSNTISSVLARYWPKALVVEMQRLWWPDKPLQEIGREQLQSLAKQIHAWQLVPSGTEGYRTAEVTKGGVEVDQISSKTMRHKDQRGLFFVGEVLDVTGHLGGFNFQWAWSSGYVAGLHC